MCIARNISYVHIKIHYMFSRVTILSAADYSITMEPLTVAHAVNWTNLHANMQRKLNVWTRFSRNVRCVSGGVINTVTYYPLSESMYHSSRFNVELHRLRPVRRSISGDKC